MIITASILSFIISCLVVYLITPSVILFAQKFGLVDDPSSRSHPANTHKGIIPRAGGLAIYLGVLVGSFLFIPGNKIISGVLIGSGLIVIVGLLDDKYDLSPYTRFVANVVIVGITILFGLGIPYISNPLGGVIHLDTVRLTLNFFGQHSFLLFANVFALLWIVAIMNFVNWSSGIDGQLSGFVTISSIAMSLLAYRFTGHDISYQYVAFFGCIVAGAFLGFLPWNFYPQKIMPGYSGGALAGFFLGVLSILSWGKIGTLLLVLSIPFVDALYAILRRLKNKKSPFRGDSLHFHHRLLRIGWGRRRIAVFYWIVSALFGAAALSFEGLQKFFALCVVIVLLGVFIIITNKILVSNKKTPF